MSGSGSYQVRIRIQGELSTAWWSDVFGDLTLEPEAGGTTLVSGVVPDQTALHGLLAAIRDLGLTLVAVDSVAEPEPAPQGES